MGRVKLSKVAPGLVDTWRLWRHCLCRFGWYPMVVAPLVTCACLLDLYSSTSCDFIRLSVGFTPTNGAWNQSYAELGIFSFDSHEDDTDRWKKTFNNGCRAYSSEFEDFFIDADQTWFIARIMAYTSGISGLIATAMAWLMTITPLPASFFWPGVLLPAVILAMLTGSAKFLFFDAQICSGQLWYRENESSAVGPDTCLLGESAIYGIASAAAFFLCTILICFRSPTKRELDEDFGKTCEEFVGGPAEKIVSTEVEGDRDVEGGEDLESVAVPDISSGRRNDAINPQSRQNLAQPPRAPQNKRQTRRSKEVETNQDETMMYGADSFQPIVVSFNDDSVNLGITRRAGVNRNDEPDEESDRAWNANEDSVEGSARQDSYADFSITKAQSYNGAHAMRSDRKNQAAVGKPQRTPNGKGMLNNTPSKDDSESVGSRISKISFAETHSSEDSVKDKQKFDRGKLMLVPPSSAYGSYPTNSAPDVVAIPKSGTAAAASSPLRPMSTPQVYAPPGKARYTRRDDRNDASSRRERAEMLPPLKESLTPTGGGTPMNGSNREDHGDLINKLVSDLEKSFISG